VAESLLLPSNEQTRAAWKRNVREVQKAGERQFSEHVRVSNNSKTGVSVNVPLSTCSSKTSACSKYCYALRGPISFTNSVSVEVNNQAVFDSLKTASQQKVDYEASLIAGQVQLRGHPFLRWNGSGELTPGAVRVLEAFSRLFPTIPVWVSTRSMALARSLPPKRQSLHIMLSTDSTTSAQNWQDTIQLKKERDYFIAWTRIDQFEVVPKEVDVVFNLHLGIGRLDKKCVRTCPATLPNVNHDQICTKCQFCWKSDRRKKGHPLNLK